MPRISCVIATRDRDKYIKEAVDSIIAQTETDWELIIVDDHSQADDKTEEIITAIKDSRIKYYRLKDQNGMGIACARNFGNTVASANIIAVMDSDDISYPKRFEWTLDELQNSKADIVYSDIDYWFYDENDRIEKYQSRAFNLSDFKRYDFIPHASSSYYRQIVLDNPYNSFFQKAEDYDLFSRLYSLGYKFHYISKSLLKYRKHNKSITVSTDNYFDYPEMVRIHRKWR